MSKVLMIRHLPTELPFRDKEQLLKHFGAENVWETSSKRNYLFASFGSVDKAKASMMRLHQLEIAKRRLVVEYSLEKEQVKQNKDNPEQTSTATKLVKEAFRLLNAWNPSVDFYQPPPPHLKYKYPDITPETVINIIHALFTHRPFYTQALHLMNKMCLKTPFALDPDAVTFFRVKFKKYFLDEIQKLTHSESESEISSDETVVRPQHLPKVVKRRNKLPVPSRKRPAPTLTNNPPKIKKIINQEEVFEQSIPVLEPKKIQLVVHQDALEKPSEEPDIIGELGKFQPGEQPTENKESTPEPELPVITMTDLMKNRLSHHNIKVLPVYKNYHPGEPSMRLYIKNLAKTVTEQDVKSIYKLFIQNIDPELTGFDVRVMQEGRMKGQAFVTFPSIKMAEVALEQTNGYMLKKKPMVVQFARAANKKTIE